MGVIVLPERKTAREELDTLENQISELEEQLETRRRVLDELCEQASEVCGLEAEITDAKRAIFLLMRERLRQSELAAVDQVVSAIEKVLEAAQAGKQKGGG